MENFQPLCPPPKKELAINPSGLRLTVVTEQTETAARAEGKRKIEQNQKQEKKKIQNKMHAEVRQRRWQEMEGRGKRLAGKRDGEWEPETKARRGMREICDGRGSVSFSFFFPCHMSTHISAAQGVNDET